MKNGILCAIDFSDSSREALHCAVDLARRLKSHLTILYTYRLTKAIDGEPIALKKTIEDQALTNFRSLEKDFLDKQGISYEFKSEVGFITDRLKEHVKRNGLSFVVISQDNAGRHESFDEIVSSVKVPLVLVP